MPPHSALNEELGAFINEGAEENLAELHSEQATADSSLSTKAQLGSMATTLKLVSDTLKGLVARLGSQLKKASAANAVNLGSAQKKLVPGSAWQANSEKVNRNSMREMIVNSRNFFLIWFSQPFT
jgi:hypothetical protein